MHRREHRRPHHPKREEFEDKDFYGDLTEEERMERKHQRKRYNHIFRWGMIIGTAVLGCIMVKFCVAKRRRCRQNRRDHRQPQMQMQMQGPHVMHPHAHNVQYLGQPATQPVSQYAYPVNQPVQMGRPPRA